MDRTIIETYRAEEKELSHILYEKIKGLMLLQPPNEELHKYLSDEMFLKTNHQAFFHVMAFLCRLHDPIEFRKRFLWPLTDKRSEANFRTSTIDYLKYLNDKYQLNWLNIKQYLVVMPGGMKFITFLLDFIKFIVSEQIKQREKHFTAMELQEMLKEPAVSEAYIHSILRKNSCLKESSSEYLNALHEVNTVLEEKTYVITQQLEEISSQTDLNMNLFMGETFLEKFWSHIQKLYKEKFLNKPVSVRNMEKPIENFKLLLNEFHNKGNSLTRNNSANNKEFVKHLKQKGLEMSIPQVKNIIDDYESKSRNDACWNRYVGVGDDDVDINFLMRLFNCVHDPLIMELSKTNQKAQPSQVIVHKTDELLSKLQQMKEQLNDFQKIIYSQSSNNNNLTVKPNQAHPESDAANVTCTPIRNSHCRWSRMLLRTPPIILNDSQQMETLKPRSLIMNDIRIESITSRSNNMNENFNINIKSKMDWLTPEFQESSQTKHEFPEGTIAGSQNHQNNGGDDSDLNATIVDMQFLLRSLKKADKTTVHNDHRFDHYEDDENDENVDRSGNFNWSRTTLSHKKEITPFKSPMQSPSKLNQQQNQTERQHYLLSSNTPVSYRTPRSSHRQQMQEQRLHSRNNLSAAARKLFATETVQNNDAIINLKTTPPGRLRPYNESEILKTMGQGTNIIITTATATTSTPMPMPKPKIRLNDVTFENHDNNDVDNIQHTIQHHHYNGETSNSSHDEQVSNVRHNLGDINDINVDDNDDQDKTTDIFNTSDTVLMVVTP